MKLMCYAMGSDACEMVPGRPDREWMDAFSDRHPYRCLPLVMANATGWELLCPVSFTAGWNGGPAQSDIRLEAEDGGDPARLARFATSHFTRGVLTFHTGYLFRTPPGWDLAVSGPPNRIKHGIQALVGIVETDWLPFPFTMNWRFTRPGAISFRRGEPFCFVQPTPHAAPDEFEPVVKPLDAAPDIRREYDAWAESRSTFLRNQKEGDPETLRQRWQRHYFRGETPAGPIPGAAAHISRRRLKPPRPAREDE